MNDKEAVVAGLRRVMTDRQYKNLRKGRTGGYFNGVLNYDPTVNLRPGRIWIREGEDGQRAQSEALIVGVVDNVADIPVWLAETIDSNELVVLGPVVTTRTLETWGGGLPGTGVPRQPSEISSQLIRADNITVGRIGPSTYSPATLYVTIGAFWHNNRFLGGIEYDVGSGNLPGSAGQYRWAFICVDDDNNAYTVTGTAAGAASKSSLLVASAADIAIPAGYIPVGLVSLAYGQTAISDSRFEDPRNWIAPRGTLLSEDSATLTIASGAVTVGSGSHFVMAAESGTADDLATITASGIPRMIVIRADSGDTITVKHGTGNISLNDEVDYDLSGDKHLALFWTGAEWSDLGAPGDSINPVYYFQATSDAASIGAAPADLTFSFTSGNVTRNDGSCWGSGAATEISAPAAGVYQLVLHLTPDDVAYANISGTLRMERYDSGDSLVESVGLLGVYNADAAIDALTSMWMVSIVRHFDAGDYIKLIFNDQAATDYGPFWTLEKLTWFNLIPVT